MRFLWFIIYKPEYIQQFPIFNNLEVSIKLTSNISFFGDSHILCSSPSLQEQPRLYNKLIYKSPFNKMQHKMNLQEIQEFIKADNNKQKAEQQKEKEIPEKIVRRKVGIRQGCENINNYTKLNRIHEGTYGVVYRAQDPITKQIIAIKKLKLVDGADFPITSLRQITLLRSINHENIIKIQQVIGNSEHDKVFIVMQYMEHQLKQLLKSIQFNESQVKRLMKDLLKGIQLLHQRNIVHRDLKTSNLLYSNNGILKICDFGLARKASLAMMTQQVISLRYRAPQLLLGPTNYSVEIDIWSVGCIFAQLILGDTIFQGNNEIQQLDTIFRVIGSPTNESWPNYKQYKNSMYVVGNKYPQNKLRSIIPKQKLSDEGVDLLKKMLTAYPKKRISGQKCLKHDWFKSEICPRQSMPQHDAINEMDRVRKRIKKQ